MLRLICAALAVSLFVSKAHAEYYYDFHFNDLSYQGQDYPAADIVYSSDSIVSQVNQTVSYVGGNVNGYEGAFAIVYDASGYRVAFASPPDDQTDPAVVSGFGFGAEESPLSVGTYPSNNDAGRLFYVGGGQSNVYYTRGEMTISTANPVPEPAAICLLSFGLPLLLRRRRRSD